MPIMSGFLFAFIACLLASLGARDQLLVAQMSARQGQRPGLLIVALFSAFATTALAAWLATVMAAQVPGKAKLVFAGIALVLAGGEALLLAARKPPAEPTNSLFAALVVLAAQQLTDAVRFLVLALALLTASPITAGMGGAASGVIGLGAAWMMPEIATQKQLPMLRRLAGVFLLAAGIMLGWRGMS